MTQSDASWEFWKLPDSQKLQILTQQLADVTAERDRWKHSHEEVSKFWVETQGYLTTEQQRHAETKTERDALAKRVEKLEGALETISTKGTALRKQHSGPGGADSLSMERNMAIFQTATEFKKLALEALNPTQGGEVS